LSLEGATLFSCVLWSIENKETIKFEMR